MAYSTGNPARLTHEGGIANVGSSGAGIKDASGNIFRYSSSHGSTDISGVAGFFAGCGANPQPSTGPLHPNVVSRSPANIGMRPGDILINVQSSDGAAPGTATLHGVSASTWGGTTSSSTGGAIGYNCTVI